MWRVSRIDEADFGCEERMPGEPLMVLVTIESDDGRTMQMECAEDFLIWVRRYATIQTLYASIWEAWSITVTTFLQP